MPDAVRAFVGNFKGPKGEQGPQGIQGPAGPQGIQGPAGPSNADGIYTVDTSGVLVSAGESTDLQRLIDAIADKVMTKLLAKTDIVQVESTATNKVPSSAYLKQVKDSIDSNLAENLGKLISFSSETSYTSSAEMMNYIQNTAPIGYSVLYNNANNTISTCYTYKASNNTLHVMRITTNGQSSLDAALHWCSGGAWNSKRITPT